MRSYDLVVSVGDFFPWMVSALFLHPRKLVFVSTAKSDLFERHYGLETVSFKFTKTKVFARDAITALSLKSAGVDAEFAGNVMMDLVSVNRSKSNPVITIGILPGSRHEAYSNFLQMREVISKLPVDWKFLLAIPSNLDMNHFDLSGFRHSVTQVSFDEMLSAVDAVIGLAGTANEQCIGYGIPVFCFQGTGPQTTRKRFLDQNKLLKGLTEFVPSKQSDIIAKRIEKRMKEVSFFERVRTEGPKVMGKPGGAKAIAEEIECILES